MNEASSWRTRQTENVRPVLQNEDTIAHDGRRWGVLESGGVFHVRLVSSTVSDTEVKPPYVMAALKAHGVIYRPIHPSMTVEDIEGATYAHDDGTHWHFAHCSPHEQIDLAAHVQTFAEAQFATLIQRALLKAHEATNAPVKAAAVAKAAALVLFAAAVGAAAHKAIVGATLGHWHRDPHHDHSRDQTRAAIDTVLAEWAETGKTDKAVRLERAAVLASAGIVKALLEADHAIEWRAARVARLAAEKKAKEAADAADASNGDGS